MGGGDPYFRYLYRVGFDGMDLRLLSPEAIYRPSDFDPAKQYPIIDAQYASPLTAVVPHNFYTAFRGLQPLAPSSYAELGFIVISVDAGYDVSLGRLFASPVRGVESHRSR